MDYVQTETWTQTLVLDLDFMFILCLCLSPVIKTLPLLLSGAGCYGVTCQSNSTGVYRIFKSFSILFMQTVFPAHRGVSLCSERDLWPTKLYLNTALNRPAVSQLSGYSCLLMSLRLLRQECWEVMALARRDVKEKEAGHKEGRKERKGESAVHLVQPTFSTQSHLNTTKSAKTPQLSHLSNVLP